MSPAAIRQVRSEERGFTLPEVLITIVIMGIVFAIASSAWFGVVDSRRVDAAANQLASDLRKAHQCDKPVRRVEGGPGHQQSDNLPDRTYRVALPTLLAARRSNRHHGHDNVQPQWISFGEPE